ncbi:MAG: hypothetical protein RLZZ230_282 [Candidatus Parcubacteria bacterium]|jgi:hypothetical protein
MKKYINPVSLITRILLGTYVLILGGFYILSLDPILVVPGVSLVICSIIAIVKRGWLPNIINKKIDRFIESKHVIGLIFFSYVGILMFVLYMYSNHPTDWLESSVILTCTILAMTRFPINPLVLIKLSAR